MRLCVLSGAMISIVRLLEKPGPALYSPECVVGVFSELRLYHVIRSCFGSLVGEPTPERCALSPTGCGDLQRPDIGGLQHPRSTSPLLLPPQGGTLPSLLPSDGTRLAQTL